MEGHLISARRILGYLKKFGHGRMIFDTGCIDHSQLEFKDQEWKDMYPDAVEDIPHDMPAPKGKPVQLTVYVDADHAHDKVTRRSVTGIILFGNKTPLKAISKRQKTVETSTYGSELVAAKIAVELVMGFRYQLRMLGVNIKGPATMLGDNMSVVLNTTVPSSSLKKKCNAIAYHRVREAIAANIINFAHVNSKDNFADVCTKPLGAGAFHRVVRPILFRVSSHLPRGDNDDDILKF